jgi:integrase
MTDACVPGRRESMEREVTRTWTGLSAVRPPRPGRPDRQINQRQAGPESADHRGRARAGRPPPGCHQRGPGCPVVHRPARRPDSTAVLRDATHWDDVVIRLGYEHLRRHDLRHTGLTWMADAGVPVHVLRKIAGHGSLTTTQRYLHPDERSITEAGDALTAHLSVRRSPSGPQLRVV